jgi:PAS domain-containing protein
LTRWHARDVIGRNFDEICTLIHEHTGDPVESPVSRALRQDMAGGFANGLLLVTADGRRIPVMESISAIREEEHTIFGVTVLFKDQTEQRIRQRHLEESEIKYRSLFETTSDAIALWQVSVGENDADFDAILLDCNERFAQFLGSVSTELTGRLLQDCCVFDTDVILPLLRSIVASRTPSVTEVHVPSLRRYFNVSLYTPAEARVAMMLHDITEQKNAENTLIAKIEELERFNHVVVNREIRMIELKQEVNDMLKASGRPEKYRITK